MTPTSLSARARVGLAAALVVPAAFLGACSAVGGGAGCRGTAAELKYLAAQPVLGSAPAGAAAPANYRGVGVTTGCDDDSSGRRLHAERLYAFPGGPGDVMAHYTRTASAAGWQPEHDPGPKAPDATIAGACWTRTDKGRHLLLSVDFRTGGYAPAPKTAGGIAYEVSVGTTSDGSGGEASCWH
ncbi:hypothetical protein [Streptomyces collinus]|uniref:hypothetical protein n=1 Tax=Streptomyces collinus TaxID=42684 RepID=UPI0033F50E39